MTDQEKICSAAEHALQAFTIEAEALLMQHKVLCSNTVAQAAGMLATASVIGASACGHTGISCMHFAHLMCCIGKPARFIPPSEAVHGGLGFLQPGSIMLLASRGGRTTELLPIQTYCKAHHVKTIVVTENTDSVLARDADLLLPIVVNRETDKYNSQGTTSFIVMSAVFDVLQTAMIEIIGFTNEQFAAIHPGGAVGARLNGGSS